MTIRQHIPGFVDGIDPDTAEFSSLAELKLIPWVARFAAYPDFVRFSVSGSATLMSENLKSWWVIGFLSEDLPELPRWEQSNKEPRR